MNGSMDEWMSEWVRACVRECVWQGNVPNSADFMMWNKIYAVFHVPGCFKFKVTFHNTPNANMEDRSVGAGDELYESEVSQSLMFCFDNASLQNSFFVVDLFCFISLCLRVAVFLNATRRDRNLPPFNSKEITDQWKSLRKRNWGVLVRRAPLELILLRFRIDDFRKIRLNDKLMCCLVVCQHDCDGQ